MCGNLGFLLVDAAAPNPVDILLSMGQVTSMRGAQSFGFAASGKNVLRVHKAVVRKREDIAVNLSRAFARTMGSKVRTTPLAVCAHLRFATSSKTTRRDAHPHVWLQNVRCEVVTLNPTTQTFARRSVSRAVVVTHNGDFEAFDLGGCFRSTSKCVDLEVLRVWLTKRLGRRPPSSGDSIVAAGMLELLFAAGDPLASARLAFAEQETAASDEAPRNVVEEAATVLSTTLVALADTVTNELSYSLNGQLTKELRDRRMRHVADVVAEALQSNARVANFLGTRGNLRDMAGAVALAAVRAFFEADLRSATRRFLKYAHGSFGLAVSSSLAPCAIVVASIKQPMSIGIAPGMVVYGSERAALRAGAVGDCLVARRLLRDGDVVWIAPSVQESISPDCAYRLATASTKDDHPFRPIRATDLDAVVENPLVTPVIRSSAMEGDVVGKEIAEIPTTLRHVRDSFADPTSTNSETAANLARRLFLTHRDGRVLDLVVVGVESSLWLAEQFAANMRSAFPTLRVVAASANKVLASLTAVANDATCGAMTPGFTVFPSGHTPAASVRDAVALVVSHSGQTFPSLNASRALAKAGAIVFAAAGSQDTVIASDVLGQSFALGAAHSRRQFSTDAGIRLAEAASLTTVALHVLLTEVLYALAVEVRGMAPATHDDCALVDADLADLKALHDDAIDKNVPMLCEPATAAPAGDVENPSAAGESPATTRPYDEAVYHGQRWGNHVVEPFLAFGLSVLYVLVTVTVAAPVLGVVAKALGAPGSLTYAINALDALLYAFFPVVAALGLRAAQGRELLARFGKRTILVLDVPQVHQCVVAFAQKLFGLAYGLNGVEVAGFNPSDHAPHRCLHRVVRGTLVALGVPDGRLRSLIDAECAAFLTAKQIKSIENWGVGPELVTIGHHTYNPGMVDGAIIFDAFKRPAFLSEVAHGTGTKSVAVAPKKPKSPSSFLAAAQAASFSKKLAARPKPQTSTSDARRIAFLERPNDQNIGDHGSDMIGGGSGDKTANLRDVVASHTVVETLYEGRVAILERQIAFYVFFYTMARRASTALWPFFHFDTWRSQAGTRVATTPSPTSPATEVSDPLPRQAVRMERVTTLGAFHDRQGSNSRHASHADLGGHHHFGDLFHLDLLRDRKAYDTLPVDNDSDHGLDLSAHDAAVFWHAQPMADTPRSLDQVKLSVDNDKDHADPVSEEV